MLDELYADDIPWKLAPLPPPPDVTLTPSQPTELGLAYAEIVALEHRLDSALADVAMMRELAQQALDQLSVLTVRCQKLAARCQDQTAQIAALMGVGSVT